MPDPRALAFAAVSAFGTAGIDARVTLGLTAGDKLVVMVLMFAGRAGPLTQGIALGMRARRADVSHLGERVMVG